MTAPNAALAYRALDQIDARPELWDQGYWFTVTDCGTAGCIAGWACVLSGDKPSPWEGLMEDLSIGDQVAHVDLPTGERVEARERARALLGITEEQAQDLFWFENTRGVLGRLVERIFGPRPDGGEGGNATDGGAS